MGERGALSELIRKARHRHASHVVMQQAVFASTIALAGCVALLLFGTQLLSVYWIGILFIAGLMAGLYRAKSRFLSRYEVAQCLDSRLDLKDKLSTALFFRENSAAKHASQDVIERQRASAEEAARTADLSAGMPIAVPKAMYAAVILAMVSLGVFAVRYGVTRSLDLKTSLVQIAFNGLLGSEDVASAKKKGGPPKPGERPKEETLHVDPWESKTLDAQGPSDDVLKTVDTPDVNNQSYNSDANAKAQGTPAPDPVQQPGESGDSADRNGSDQMAENAPSAPNKEGKSDKQQKGGDQDKQGANSSDNSSLADKVRDALQNLMSKMKTQPKPEGKQGSGQSQQGQQNAQKKNQDEKGASQPGKPQDANSSPDQQGDQEGQSADKSASAQNKSGSKNSDRPPTQDGKSGVGKEDGDKSAREAEQLAAMGKISEIIGKRAANMQGEVMVEVSSGKQQLKTQYSQSKAAHADAGGEINRDEVPLAYQPFVQQYFEEIRKPAPAPAPAPAATPAKTKN